jgi:hypothetical protein
LTLERTNREGRRLQNPFQTLTVRNNSDCRQWWFPEQ